MRTGNKTSYLLPFSIACLLGLSLLNCHDEVVELEFSRVITDPYDFEQEVGSVQLNGSFDGLMKNGVIRKGFLISDSIETSDSLVLTNTKVSILEVTNLLDNKFDTIISNLNLDKIYYFRAFAQFNSQDVNGVRLVYGPPRIIRFDIEIIMDSLLAITNNTVILKGRVNNLPNSVKVMNHGYVYSDKEMPSLTDGISVPVNLGLLDHSGPLLDTMVGGLEFNKTYFVRAWLSTPTTTYYSVNTSSFTINDGWEPILACPMKFQDGVAVSDNDFGYVITGCSDNDNCASGDNTNNLFEYDPIKDKWVLISTNNPPSLRHNAIGFLIDGIIYYGFGEKADDSQNLFKDVKSLKISDNDWIQVDAIKNSLAPARSRAVSFVIKGKAYFGTGKGNQGARLNDFWQYDPVSDSCRRMADLNVRYTDTPLELGREDAIAFVLNDRGYVMGGITAGSIELKDIWEFTPPASSSPKDIGSWTFKTFFPGESRSKAVAFTIGETAYISTGISQTAGYLGDLWAIKIKGDEIDIQIKTPFLGGKRDDAVSFVVNGIGYVGSGYTQQGMPLMNITFGDFWKYVPKN